jgi:DNA-binding response OmpR family regulator
MKLAVITHRTSLFRLICESFDADGAICSQFADDVTLARALYRDDFSAVLIDANTGVNPLRPILARRACLAEGRVPLIVIGARDDHGEIARLLDAGADDVVLAPVNTRELTLRVRCALRRVQPAAARDVDKRLACGVYVLDRRASTVSIEGELVKLTAREFAIAWLLFSHAGEYVSRRQIAGAVWRSSEEIAGRTLEQHVYKLRKKLWLCGQHGARLQTMYAYGYRIEITEVTEASEASADAAASIEAAFAAMNAESELAPRRAARHGARRAEVHVASSVNALDAQRWPNAEPGDMPCDWPSEIHPHACLHSR